MTDEPTDEEIVDFKSTPENFEKEMDGRKCNTVRVAQSNDSRFHRSLAGKIKAVRISEVKDGKLTGRRILRRLTDLTIWDGIYIYSWADEKKIADLERENQELLLHHQCPDCKDDAKKIADLEAKLRLADNRRTDCERQLAEAKQGNTCNACFEAGKRAQRVEDREQAQQQPYQSEEFVVFLTQYIQNLRDYQYDEIHGKLLDAAIKIKERYEATHSEQRRRD